MDGIKVNRKGEVRIDSSKINPYILKVVKKKFEKSFRQASYQTGDSKYDKKIILKKAQRTFNNNPYHISVYKIERMIKGLGGNEVFQEYEIFYCIKARAY